MAINETTIHPHRMRAASLVFWLLTIAAVLLTSAPVRASDDAAPPARVGRISHLEGTVQYYAEAQPDVGWVGAIVNLPITSRSSVFASGRSRAEIRIGSTSVRLDHDTQADFTVVDDDGIHVEAARGTVSIRVRSLAADDSISIGAGGATLQVRAPGTYAIRHDAGAGHIVAKVHDGSAVASFGETATAVGAGQQAVFDAESRLLAEVAGVGRSRFDEWAAARDRSQDHLASHRYVSPELTGAEALDAHGQWATVPEHGTVWYPRTVVEGWAPYRHGRWIMLEPWGWTWVDEAPWGFATSHYGRWALIGERWAWVPGGWVARPVWAPALVGFRADEGVSFAATIGSGPVGWFPLAPHEVYRPPYTSRVTYVQALNAGHVGSVTVISSSGYHRHHHHPWREYRYSRFDSAVTTMPPAAFAHRRWHERPHAQLPPPQWRAGLATPGRVWSSATHLARPAGHDARDWREHGPTVFGPQDRHGYRDPRFDGQRRFESGRHDPRFDHGRHDRDHRFGHGRGDRDHRFDDHGRSDRGRDRVHVPGPTTVPGLQGRPAFPQPAPPGGFGPPQGGGAVGGGFRSFGSDPRGAQARPSPEPRRAAPAPAPSGRGQGGFSAGGQGAPRWPHDMPLSPGD